MFAHKSYIMRLESIVYLFLNHMNWKKVHTIHKILSFHYSLYLPIIKFIRSLPGYARSVTKKWGLNLHNAFHCSHDIVWFIFLHFLHATLFFFVNPILFARLSWHPVRHFVLILKKYETFMSQVRLLRCCKLSLS